MTNPQELQKIQEAMVQYVREHKKEEAIQKEFIQNGILFYVTLVIGTTVLIYATWNILSRIFKRNY